MTVSNKIKHLLIERDMTIKELAERLNTSGNNVSNKLRRDNFSEKEIKKIAEALNCDYNISFIMRDTGEKI